MKEQREYYKYHDQIDALPLESLGSEKIDEPSLVLKSDFHSLMVEKLSDDSISKFNQNVIPEVPKNQFFVCDLCDYQSKSLALFNRHKMNHRNCTVCDKSFSGKRSLELFLKHLKEHESGPALKLSKVEKEIHKCHVCNEIFPYKSYLIRHTEKSHNQRSSDLKLDTFNTTTLVEADKLIVIDTPQKIFVKSDSKMELINCDSEKIQPDLNQQNQMQPNEIIKQRSRKQKFVERESFE